MTGASYHHGPEIIEDFTGASSVIDVPAGICFLIGTAPIQNVHTSPLEQAGYINQPILVRAVEDYTSAFGPAADGAGYSIPEALQAAFNKDVANKGIGTFIVVNVFNPAVHKDAQNAPDPTKVTAADIIGSVSAAGIATGLQLAYVCYNRFGFWPRLIEAPRFTTLAGVREAMLIVANNVLAHAIWDETPGCSKQQAITDRGVSGPYNTSSERAVICYPQLLALDMVGGENTLQPFSQHLAGVWNMLATQIGPHASPSNRLLPDVAGMETDITFIPGSYASDTDLLNQNGIVTVMNYYGSGIKTFGAASAAWPTQNDQMSWLHGRAVADCLEHAILLYCLPYVDQWANPGIVDAVEERIRAYLHSKEPQGDGWLYGSSFAFNRTKTTAEGVANKGQIYYKLTFAVMGIMHRITIESSIDLSFVATALGLSAPDATAAA